ncbi:hypothetical protein NKH84_21330 [Mesorhizobium sp. M0902]|uniref:hypothetical protein n=1 Tax=unclassified Mesorhizobium TaxID=325217 RepID=UPI003338D96A
MKADIFFPEKLPAERGSAMHEGGRLALKRDQQKWNPVLRPIALRMGLRDQQKWNPVLRHPLAFSPCGRRWIGAQRQDG